MRRAPRRVPIWIVLAPLVWGIPATARAQIVETVGSRALGMGGAFVAVANDSSATWWNPAGLAAGPFLDVAIGRAVTSTDELPGSRDRGWSFALATPPLGISYYRLRITDIRPFDPTAEAPADREDRGAGLGLRSMSVSQFGATILHTVLTGVHAGATVKYVRATARQAAAGDVVPAGDRRAAEGGLLGPDADELLDRGDDLAGGDAEGAFDVDVGVLAVAGPLRLGALARNLREPAFGERRLPRQVRVGAAFDGEAAGLPPLTISIDADVRTYEAGAGDRRVIALGGEQWLFARTLGVRAGARFNTVGARGEAVTAGASVAPRPGMYIDAHVVRGGEGGEDGWGLSARVSF